MNLPNKPSSGSWVKDAEALIEMGAKSIDAKTVQELLNLIKSLEANRKEVFEELDSVLRAFGDEYEARLSKLSELLDRYYFDV